LIVVSEAYETRSAHSLDVTTFQRAILYVAVYHLGQRLEIAEGQVHFFLSKGMASIAPTVIVRQPASA